MKKVFFISLFAIAFLNTSLKGQGSLGIDDSSSFVPNNIYFNTSYTYKATVKNYGLLTYSGPVQVFFAVDSGSNNSPVILTSLTPTITLASNDTSSVSTSINTDSSKFRSGINTVVIWPKNTSTAFVTHDSLKTSVTVLGYMGIENYADPKPWVFPNPMQNQLFVANKNPNFVIEQVRIWDISGRLVYAEKFKGSIDVSKFERGAYTLEFSDKHGRTSRYKVIKE